MSTATVTPALMDTTRAAEYLGVKLSKFYTIRHDLVRNGVTPRKLPGRGKRCWWVRKELDAYIEQLPQLKT